MNTVDRCSNDADSSPSWTAMDTDLQYLEAKAERRLVLSTTNGMTHSLTATQRAGYLPLSKHLRYVAVNVSVTFACVARLTSPSILGVASKEEYMSQCFRSLL